jgi:hypothetical protein
MLSKYRQYRDKLHHSGYNDADESADDANISLSLYTNIVHAAAEHQDIELINDVYTTVKNNHARKHDDKYNGTITVPNYDDDDDDKQSTVRRINSVPYAPNQLFYETLISANIKLGEYSNAIALEKERKDIFGADNYRCVNALLGILVVTKPRMPRREGGKRRKGGNRNENVLKRRGLVFARDDDVDKVRREDIASQLAGVVLDSNSKKYYWKGILAVMELLCAQGKNEECIAVWKHVVRCGEWMESKHVLLISVHAFEACEKRNDVRECVGVLRELEGLRTERNDVGQAEYVRGIEKDKDGDDGDGDGDGDDGDGDGDYDLDWNHNGNDNTFHGNNNHQINDGSERIPLNPQYLLQTLQLCMNSSEKQLAREVLGMMVNNPRIPDKIVDIMRIRVDGMIDDAVDDAVDEVDVDVDDYDEHDDDDDIDDDDDDDDDDDFMEDDFFDRFDAGADSAEEVSGTPKSAPTSGDDDDDSFMSQFSKH